MADNNTEEKSLPASSKKLRDSRRKGKVSSSRDLISGFGLLTMMVYLFLGWSSISDSITELIEFVSNSTAEPFMPTIQKALSIMMDVYWYAIAPPIAILIFVSVIIGMAGTLGPVFSFESIKPNFEHINPAAGLKRIFSVRNATEFGKTLVKLIILGGVLFLVLRYWLQAMFHAPNCGEACITPLLLAALKPILIIATLAFIAIGFTDIALQRWLFLRDMRMTRTEAKRERKDLEGDPLILGARKRDRQQRGMEPRLGLSASSVIIAGDRHIAGLWYHRQNMPLPMITIKSVHDSANAILKAAQEMGIPITEHAELARSVAQNHRPGDHVDQKYFADIAQVLIQHQLV